MIRRPPRSTQSRSSAASDVYKRQESALKAREDRKKQVNTVIKEMKLRPKIDAHDYELSLIHISEPTRPY